jgi:DNA-binding response OmpR family regulator
MSTPAILKNADQDLLRVPSGVIDWAIYGIQFDDGNRCKLSRMEAELLKLLAKHSGRPVSRGELLSRVWQLDPGRTMTRTVDMHIAKLRKKLNDRSCKLLVTVRGVGYMLVARSGKSR